MKPLLYLVHRIPYPPNKGDKIRSFNLMKYLSRRYRLYLGAFVDDPEDWRYEKELFKYCEAVCLRDKPGVKSVARIFQGLLRGEALTVPYYYDAAMRRWVEHAVVNEGVEHAIVYSSAMAQYISGKSFSDMYRVIDFVDVDSDKWRQYAKSRSFPMNWVYRRESQALRRYEESVATCFDLSLFVTSQEAEYFAKDSDVPDRKISFYNNGVDLEYFTPNADYECPYEKHEQAIVFTGAMDYWANVDAVEWFVRRVLEKVRAQMPAARFYIVGSNPLPQVTALGRMPGVTVTGKVPDVRPYLAHASAAVAPLRIARGVQNKVLESMAMALPVLATSAAAHGIHARPGTDLLVADEPEEMAMTLIDLLRHGEDGDYGKAARACVEKYYDWENNLQMLSDCLVEGHAGG